MRHVVHLAKRFVLSMVPKQVQVIEQQWVASVLTAHEFDLWNELMLQDRRHSIMVARRYVALRPMANNYEIAGALLHDVGKSVSRLGTLMRVVATIVGPRTTRLRVYHDHETIGANMLRTIGSDSTTIAMVQGSCSPELKALLAMSDDL